MTQITLSADDYAQNPAISEGILALIAQNRLNAVSCLTTSPLWPNYAKKLIPFKNTIDLGLHFDLTEFHRPFGSLASLLTQACFRRLNRKVIAAAIRKQLDQFVDEIGELPHFIDGHQHVHQFPVIRDQWIDAYHDRLQARRSYFRVASNEKLLGNLPSNPGFIKSLIISLSGGFAFRQLVQSNHIPHNQSFAGIYSFQQSEDYAKFFPLFLQNSKDRGIIMCHPGLLTDESLDPLAQSRYHEYVYLSSEQFLQDCAEYQVVLGRFRENRGAD